MMENGGYSLADIAAATGNSGNDGFGGNNGWWIILLFLALGGRWGGQNGGGSNGGGSGQPIVIENGRSGSCGCGCSPCATQADLAAGFNNSAVLSNLNDLQLGQASLQNTLCQGFNGLNTTVLQGFNGVERSFCDLGYAFKDCCCQTQRAIDGVNFNLAKGLCDLGNVINSNTRDVLENNNNNARAILDFLTQDKISTLQAENQTLRFQASQTAQNAFITANQEAQTAELIRRLGADCPQPAYLVNGPTPISFPTNGCGQVQFANSGCGCGCGSY